MAEPISFFDLLFPVKGREITATAERVGALPPTPAPDTTSAIQSTVALQQPSVPFRLSLGTRLADWVAAYVAAQAPGIAQQVAIELPATIPAQQAAATTYTPPAGTVLILTAPLTLSTRTHTAHLTATVTVDATAYASTPMVEDDAIALAADAVIQRLVGVEWVNDGWVDIVGVLAVQGIAVDSTVWARTILPLAEATYQALQLQPAQGGSV